MVVISNLKKKPIKMKSVLELLKHFYIQRIIMYGIIAVFSFLVIVPLGDLRVSAFRCKGGMVC